MRRILALTALAACSALAATAASGSTTSRFEQRIYSTGTDSRDYWLYVPSGYTGQRIPLVVVLHGCSQDAVSIARDTQFNEYAERDTFLVAYPNQPSSANAGQCWNWFLPEHQRRGSGEAALIAGIATSVAQEFDVNPRRIHATGMSAGAAMSVIMGATYPDVFASIGVSAGLEYRAGEDLVSGVLAMQAGGPDPDTQGALAFVEMGRSARTLPRSLVAWPSQT